MLFGKKELYYDASKPGSYYNASATVTARRAAEDVFAKIMEQGAPLTIKEMTEEVSHGTLYKSKWSIGLDISAIYDKFEDKKTGDVDYDAANKVVEKHARVIVKNFVKDHKGKYFFIFHYADEDGSFGSIMEHQGLFKKLPSLVISNH